MSKECGTTRAQQCTTHTTVQNTAFLHFVAQKLGPNGVNKKKETYTRIPTSISGPNTAVARDTQSPARVPSKTVKTRSAVIANSATSTQ